MDLDSFLSCDKSKEPDLYSILGCNELSNTEQIITEYRIKAKQFHPDRNLDNVEYSTEQFAILQNAKEILTNPQKRKDYDNWRNSGIHITFQKWCSNKEIVGMAMHWKNPKLPNASIEDPSSSNINSPGSMEQTSSMPNKDILIKFRNYQV